MHRNLGAKDLNLPQYFNNRELSWLDFNYRVLQEASDKNNPLLEQLNFVSIFSSNLDEFFMVRVAGLQDQVKMGYDKPENKAQLTPKQQLNQINIKNKQNVDLQYKRYNELVEDLRQHKVEIVQPDELPESLLSQLQSEFKTGILPTLTPLGIDAYHPFPKLNNKSLNIFVDIDTEDAINSAIVQIPSLIPRFYSLNKGDTQFIIMVEDIITHFINDLFSGYEVLNTFTFRITRNADLTIHEDGAEDLLIEIERFLKERKRGTAVRLEVDGRFATHEDIVDFIREAAEDPDTIAIKQTLYRVSKDSPIINSLKTAAENGKQVTVLVELKARFDEENNVHWARMLEDAGCHVIYGMTHLKTHSKIALVVKRINNKLTSFIHLGTGNYNDKTAKLYTDMGLITTNDAIAEDALNFFNYLSGYSVKPVYNKLIVAPFDIRDVFLARIDNEIQTHHEHGNGNIIMKMNSLTDKDIILKLFEASCAGVKVQLIIRGICCLKPGIPGISENIEVVSIVGRFLEHSRIYYFHNNGDEKIYLSSADAMTRNMIKRVEILFPVEDKVIAKRLLDYMNLQLSDNQKGRFQDAHGRYHYIQNNLSPLNSQAYLMKEAVNYGQQLQDEVSQPQPHVVSANSPQGWFSKIRRTFKK
ncbi:MAG: polyphosphate kinase 1 [Staphylococcus equorum]|uniref:polyphosphate kinase 1 n=1 Tax=Staphylococcus TaxID=1279 RepID=UPI0025553401|nr:polyphosphate kinase 1 [Staphylococcus equorum]MDK9872483.1 polyphosphate kinase 1 [Staphylococcus equorum]MDK9878447.1 polyphosphate kinase 1 [Staphylococcus equorum]MDN6571390.1 polyphosphate kinase 1 [Staphylococcus equorum]MDN6611733.1 polyphosphate kinase 1 [Staphylococcus equorum]MDN6721567.1 polyphosphate kinase 1 [Staphylococcus equorum]